MTRKAFLIWGLVIIQLNATIIAISMFLAFSKVIDAKSMSSALVFSQFLVIVIGFGLILHLRFKQVGRRKQILALCVPFYFIALISGSILTLPYMDSIVSDSGAQDRFFQAIYEFADSGRTDGQVWTMKEKIDYILILIPAHYLGNWGLFALLWFGSLDPRTPSKNGFIRFMKHGFQRTSGGHIKTETSQLIHA